MDLLGAVLLILALLGLHVVLAGAWFRWHERRWPTFAEFAEAVRRQIAESR